MFSKKIYRFKTSRNYLIIVKMYHEIFGVILGYIFLKELITPKVLIALLAVIIGIYLVKRSNKINITSV